jgi:hypothetical protein
MKTDKPQRPSRLQIPPHAHPYARLVYALARENNVTLEELAWRSGLGYGTLREYRGAPAFNGVSEGAIRSYRKEKTPSLQSIEALLGVFGWALTPTPPLESLPQKTRDALEEISLDFRSDREALAAVMSKIITVPVVPPSVLEKLPPWPKGRGGKVEPAEPELAEAA